MSAKKRVVKKAIAKKSPVITEDIQQPYITFRSLDKWEADYIAKMAKPNIVSRKIKNVQIGYARLGNYVVCQIKSAASKPGIATGVAKRNAETEKTFDWDRGKSIALGMAARMFLFIPVFDPSGRRIK